MGAASGKNGEVSFDGIFVKIDRGPGGGGWGTMINQGVQGGRHIVAKHITAIEFRRADRANGFISFDFPGKNPPRGGAFDALADENAVVFTKEQNSDFENLHTEILNFLAKD